MQIASGWRDGSGPRFSRLFRRSVSLSDRRPLRSDGQSVTTRFESRLVSYSRGRSFPEMLFVAVDGVG